MIRAGYGHFFGQSPQQAQGTIGPFGFRTENPWVTSLDGITPFNLLRNPYPQGFRPSPGAAEGLLTQAGANLQAPLRDTIVPWSMQWNLNIQRELPWQTTLEVAYVGARGLQLSRNGEGGLSLNQLNPIHIEGNYTWAKNIEEGENHQDSYNIRGDRAVAGIDLAHRFVVGYLYELPFGKGRKFGANVPRVVDALIGGWQINGITSFISGTPLSISANNTAGLFNPLTRPNTNGKDPRLSGPVDQRLNKYFDTTVYTQPAPFTFGNAGATVNMRNDGIRNFDLSLFKQFTPIERLRVQFRVEALNAFNTPRFGSPNTGVTSSTFGQITSQGNSPRQLQFGLKLLW
ncbi:MAG: hypothetical protein MOB07_11425 [Acidobacteria bacterium]|nr:hypothetical protein [Acidobacteriota bacterium]